MPGYQKSTATICLDINNNNLPGYLKKHCNNLPGYQKQQDNNLPGYQKQQDNNLPGYQKQQRNNLPGYQKQQRNNLPGYKTGFLSFQKNGRSKKLNTFFKTSLTQCTHATEQTSSVNRAGLATRFSIASM